MAILKVARMGHPVLRRQADEVTAEQLAAPAMQRLIDDLIETMLDEDGIGLAAPQVHQPVRLVVLGSPGADEGQAGSVPLTVLANPRWLERSEEREEAWEGCLSVPGLRGVVPRSAHVALCALDRCGAAIELRAHGLFARVLQHEIDHLDGVLYLDRMADVRHLAYMEEFERYWATAESEDDGEEEG